MRSLRARRWVTVVVAAGLGLAGCGTEPVDPSDTTASPSAPAAPSPSPTATDGDTGTPGDAGAPDDTASPTAPDDPAPTLTPSDRPDPSPTELAGEPYDGPPLGGRPASLAVIGVSHDDVLNVRSGPGTAAEVVATLDPHATQVAATGRARLLPRSIWLEVAVDGTLGWASSSYLAFFGLTDDVTSEVVADAGGYPSAETLTGLAREVAALRASEEPPSRIVISGAPSVGDLGEVTVDVIGLADDAQVGERLVVFATPGDERFTVKAVEATQLCGRGSGLEAGCP